MITSAMEKAIIASSLLRDARGHRAASVYSASGLFFTRVSYTSSVFSLYVETVIQPKLADNPIS